MKRNVKIFIIVFFILVLIICGIQLWIYLDSTKAQMKLVVVRSYEKTVCAIDEDGELYHVSFDNPEKQNVKSLKQGQEIEIYWHGMINFMSPASIGGVKKYKILNEKSNIEIPEYAIEYCYSSTENGILDEENTAKENIETEKNVTKKLIVVKVEEKALKTMDYNEDLTIVSVENGDTSKFKQGQEILVYYDGIVITTYPGRIYADKIEILKEESDIEIPIEVLRYYNYSQDNISVKVEEISNTGIVFNITDLNEIPLDYGNNYEYSILKKNVENETYNQNLGIDYNAITPGVTTETYTTTSSYSPDPNRLKQVWEELELIGNENYKNCDWEITSEEGITLIGKSDWTNLYGELNEGEYEFRVRRKPSENDSFFKVININFIVDENGNVTYEVPDLVGW